MQQNQITSPMDEETLQNRITFLKISQSVTNNAFQQISDSCSAFYKLTLQLPIYCHSNCESNFVRQLVISLQQSAYFEYVAHLTASSPPFTAKTQTTPFVSLNHFITYCLILRIDSLNQQRVEIEQQFKEKCIQMHKILNVLKGKYKIQTRLSYWVKRFNELLRQSQKHQIQQRLEKMTQNQLISEASLEVARVADIINDQNQLRN